MMVCLDRDTGPVHPAVCSAAPSTGRIGMSFRVTTRIGTPPCLLSYVLTSQHRVLAHVLYHRGVEEQYRHFSRCPSLVPAPGVGPPACPGPRLARGGPPRLTPVAGPRWWSPAGPQEGREERCCRD